MYSILSPEGFASILWNDSGKADQAAEVMKLTAQDLYEGEIIDEIIPEPLGGAQRAPEALFAKLDERLQAQLAPLRRMSGSALVAQRYKKYRRIGQE